MSVRRRAIGIVSLLIILVSVFFWQKETVVRVARGGSLMLRDVPTGVGTQPVISHTYGFHPAIWEVFPNSKEGYRLYDLASEVGAPYMRIGFFRQWIEPQEGIYDWSTIDAALTMARERNIRIVPTFYHGHSFWGAKPLTKTRKPKSSTSAVPYDLTDTLDPETGYSVSITRFYRELLKRYPDTFPYIAVGNEPNSETYWDGTYEEYVRLFQTAAKAIHETDPIVKVIDGGLASEAWGCIAVDRLESGKWNDGEAIAFLRGYYATTRQYQKIQTATDAQITSEYLNNPEIQSECNARKIYFRGLVGHADAVNFHFYEDGAYLETVIDYLQETMKEYGWNDPVIVTNELGNKQKNNTNYDVEGAGQARDLRQKLEYATERDLPLIIWFSVNGKDSITGGFLSTHARDGAPYDAAREYRRFLEEQALILK